MYVNYETWWWNVREKSLTGVGWVVWVAETMPEPAVFLTCLMKKSPWIRDTRPKLVYLKTWSINHIIFRTTWNGKKKQWKSDKNTTAHQAGPQPLWSFQRWPPALLLLLLLPRGQTEQGCSLLALGRITMTTALEMSCTDRVQHDRWQGQGWTSDAVTGPHLTDELL